MRTLGLRKAGRVLVTQKIVGHHENDRDDAYNQNIPDVHSDYSRHFMSPVKLAAD